MASRLEMPRARPEHLPRSDFDLVALGCSAGGLVALGRILSQLPPDFAVPILVAMHLAPGHPTVLCSILQRQTRLAVRWAEEGERLRPGFVYVAPPDRHLLVTRELSCSLSSAPKVATCRPSVDVLFGSAASALAHRALAVVLSGAGSDGASGALTVRQAGGTVLAQSPASARSGGMPVAAIEMGATDLVIPLDTLPAALVSLVMVRGTSRMLGLSRLS